jgi:xanthine/uracil permease
VSSLNVAVVLTLITGFGGAIAGGFTFNAPWWSWPLMGIAGLFIGLIGAILQNQIRIRFLENEGDENAKGVASGLRFAIKLVLPFVAVILVTIITVTGSIFVTKAIWPELAENPRDLGRLEEAL